MAVTIVSAEAGLDLAGSQKLSGTGRSVSGPAAHDEASTHRTLYTRLVDRQACPLWVQGGAREIEALAREWAEAILRDRPHEPLDRRAGR